MTTSVKKGVPTTFMVKRYILALAMRCAWNIVGDMFSLTYDTTVLFIRLVTLVTNFSIGSTRTSVRISGIIRMVTGLSFSACTVLTLLCTPTELTVVAKVEFDCLVMTTVASRTFSLCRIETVTRLIIKILVLNRCSRVVFRKVSMILTRNVTRVMTGMVPSFILRTRRIMEARCRWWGRNMAMVTVVIMDFRNFARVMVISFVVIAVCLSALRWLVRAGGGGSLVLLMVRPWCMALTSRLRVVSVFCKVIVWLGISSSCRRLISS